MAKPTNFAVEINKDFMVVQVALILFDFQYILRASSVGMLLESMRSPLEKMKFNTILFCFACGHRQDNAMSCKIVKFNLFAHRVRGRWHDFMHDSKILTQNRNLIINLVM